MSELRSALYAKDWRKVKDLIKGGADANAVIGYGCNGHTPLHIAAITGCTYSVNLLIENGANHFAKDSGGSTPRLLACVHNNKEAENLLKKLFKAEPEEGWGCTAQH